jgi:AraC family transcriptional regulator
MHVLPLLGVIRRGLDEDLSLAALARVARRSPFEVHRAFRRLTGETPKRYTSRLRLDRAAAELVLGKRSVLEIALDSGFASHEVFSRAFLRRFGMTPSAYRARGLAGAGARALARHAGVVRDAGPCIGLHHLARLERRDPMSLTITRREQAPQPALFIRRQTAAGDLAATLGEILPAVFAFAQQRGVPFAGPPFTRYVEVGRGLLTVEGGMPVAVPAAGEGEIVAGELPGGPAITAVHVGPYERLQETHAAIERWMAEHGVAAAGAPWETYLTDPAEVPDPAEWRTEVVYPATPG